MTTIFETWYQMDDKNNVTPARLLKVTDTGKHDHAYHQKNTYFSAKLKHNHPNIYVIIPITVHVK